MDYDTDPDPGTDPGNRFQRDMYENELKKEIIK